MPHLSLSLLGTFHATLDGDSITRFESNRLRALLAYLAVEAHRPHSREVLAEFLWPDRPDGIARSNLRSGLSKLRSTIGDREAEPRFLLICRDTVQFNAASDHELDLTEFERYIAESGCEPQTEIRNLESAIHLYRGPFLEGLSVSESAPFEEWVLLKREEIDRQLGSALQRLALLLEEGGEYAGAEAYIRWQLELEPWSEQVHRQLMCLLALTGRRGAALVQYEACRRLLAQELGVEPARETTALYESIRDGTWSAGGEDEGSGRAEEKRHIFRRSQPGPATVRPAPFVGRDRELERLDRFLELALAGQGRVALVIGEAGSGKTALLAEFTRRAIDRHGDVVAVGGHCSAYGGVGDPYLPFREILKTLSGDIEAQRVGDRITTAQARRLRALLPVAVQGLVESGPDLIDRFVPGADLAMRVAAFSPWPGGVGARTACLAHLKQPMGYEATPQVSPASQSLAGDLQTALFEQVTRVLQALARHRALILVLDDLQWADPGSISLLFHLGRRLARSRILLIGAYRPEAMAPERVGERHPLGQVANELQRVWGDIVVDLSQADNRQFVEALLDTEPNRLGAAFRETLYRHTAGNPLFTIELLRGLQEQGDLVRDQAGRWMEGPALHWERLPPRVEAVIAERMDRLPLECQRTLSVASVEGVEFTAEVVAKVVGLDLQEIIQRLSGPLSQQNLVHAQSLQRLGPGGQRLSGYRFHHHLFQTYLYRRLDKVQRAELHEAVGRALETLHGEQAAGVAAQLAWHFEQAGLVDKAVDHLLQAGKRAQQVSANEETIAVYSHGLSLLQTLPESTARARQELSLQLGLGSALLAGRGWKSPERGRAFDRALVLSQIPGVGGLDQLFTTLSGLVGHYAGCGESQAAHDLAEQLLSLAQQARDPPYLAMAHGLLGSTWLNLGEIATSRSHLEQAIALYDAQQPGAPGLPVLGDRGTVHRAWLSLALWALGYPDQALVCSREALAVARGLDEASTLAFVLALKATLHILRREGEAAQEQAEELRWLAAEEGLAVYQAWAEFHEGWGQIGQRQFATAIGKMHQGLAGVQALGLQAMHPLHLALLAEAYGRAGRAEAGLSVLAEALRLVEQTGMRLMEAELHRLRGELLLAKESGSRMNDRPDRGHRPSSPAEGVHPLYAAAVEAENSYQRAIEVARRQQAKSWELRATTGLASLRGSQRRRGRADQARKMLSKAYGWFTEGFDTPDLRDAGALLEELVRGAA